MQSDATRAIPEAQPPRSALAGQTHERLEADAEPAGGSPRGFGLLFATVAAAFALWPLAADGAVSRWPLLAGGGTLAAVAWLAPHWLAAPNRWWTRLGLLLQRLVSPLMLAVIYFVVITPTGLAMRLFRHDPLRLRQAPDAESYWIERTPPGPAPATMADQF